MTNGFAGGGEKKLAFPGFGPEFDIFSNGIKPDISTGKVGKIVFFSPPLAHLMMLCYSEEVAENGILRYVAFQGCVNGM